MKTFTVVGVIVLLLSSPSNAVDLSVHGEMESEYDLTESRHASFSQYLFVDTEKLGARVRYFSIMGIMARGEVDVGPNFKWGSTIIKPRVGITTDDGTLGALMVNTRLSDTVSTTVIGKYTWFKEVPDTFYGKVFVGLDWLKARAEVFIVDGTVSSLKLGAEGRLKVNNGGHLYLNPYYNTESEVYGLYFGFRF